MKSFKLLKAYYMSKLLDNNNYHIKNKILERIDTELVYNGSKVKIHYIFSSNNAAKAQKLVNALTLMNHEIIHKNIGTKCQIIGKSALLEPDKDFIALHLLTMIEHEATFKCTLEQWCIESDFEPPWIGGLIIKRYGLKT